MSDVMASAVHATYTWPGQHMYRKNIFV